MFTYNLVYNFLNSYCQLLHYFQWNWRRIKGIVKHFQEHKKKYLHHEQASTFPTGLSQVRHLLLLQFLLCFPHKPPSVVLNHESIDVAKNDYMSEPSFRQHNKRLNTEVKQDLGSLFVQETRHANPFKRKHCFQSEQSRLFLTQKSFSFQ